MEKSGKTDAPKASGTPEAIIVHERRVQCKGAPAGRGGVLGHPAVWLAIGEKGWVTCPYCETRFIRDAAG